MADGATATVKARRLSADDARVVLALAEAATPAGARVRAPGDAMLDHLERALARYGETAEGAWRAALRGTDYAAVPLAGARLSSLSITRRAEVLARLADAGATQALVRVALLPVKLAQTLAAEGADTFGGLGGRGLPVVDETPRWHERLIDARELDDGETLEVDVVIVGSGAGGAPVARALAAEGHAVLVLEEGAMFGRRDFQGPAWERGLAMQRQRGLVGNAFIALPTGVTVGGSTTVNSGTCLRPPPEVLQRWRFEQDLTELTPDVMDPYFEKVAAMLEVSVATPETLGGCGHVIARGAEALGWSHGPLPRNATGCDGQGMCCFGCPTDAKRSTNVSYLPAALRSGAMLAHHCRVEEVLTAGGRAVGVVARAKGGRNARVRVLAKAVVLSAGSIGTPLMLLRQGLANRSGEVGRNLTVHPAASAWAEYDARIAGWEGIPQGYGVDEFTREGIRFEGAFVPLDVAAATFHAVGPTWTNFVDRFDRMACFGFMIAETSRGRVARAPGGEALLTYRVNDVDRRKILRGHGLLARLYLAGGARAVYTSIRGVAPLRDLDAVARFEREAPSSVAAHQIDLAAFHPLGTCRMGRDPSRSVVGASHEAHDVPGLFVVDGSCVSGPLGVNPQMTIMALAERASGFIARRVESASSPSPRRAPPLPDDAQVEFAETMAGRCTVLATGREVDTHFTVRAGLVDAAGMMRAMLGEGASWALDGHATVDGLATRSPCVGSLTMRPLRSTGTLVYDLTFDGDDGVAYTLHGEKSVTTRAMLSGMTTLPTEVCRAADGVPVARGTLRFALRDLAPWLATWRVRAQPSAAR